jgi:hypothetical protein
VNLKKYFLIIFLLKTSFFAFGQRTETAINLTPKKSHLIMEVENDMLFTTDNYYTAGLALSYTNSTFKKTPAQLILNSKNKEHLTFSGFGLEHRIFTPYSIGNPSAVENDRPYSAYVLATNFTVLINMQKKLKLSNEIGFGIMGPAVKGKEVQIFVHEVIGSVIPVGWENQLENSFLIDYQFRIEKGLFNDWLAEHFKPFVAARVGTLTDEFQVGVITKIGNKSNFLASTAKTSTIKKDFIWEWVLEANLKGVLYDATLEGGLFNKGETVILDKPEKISQQYQLRMGGNLYYKNLSFRYMVKYNSRNFTTATIHRYASLNIGLAF